MTSEELDASPVGLPLYHSTWLQAEVGTLRRGVLEVTLGTKKNDVGAYEVIGESSAFFIAPANLFRTREEAERPPR